MNRSIFSKYNIFLEWWWFFCSLILIFFVLGTVNLYEIVWNADQTKISYVILALFGAVSLFCGREAWKLSKLKRDGLDAEVSLKTKYETGWFASEICLTLGLIGMVSGFIFTIIAAYLVHTYFGFSSLSEPLIISIVLPFTATLGDFIESAYKRKAGVKDSGNFIPGHGGMLDRMDAFMITIPVIYILTYLL